MKTFDDFIKLLDAEFFYDIENGLSEPLVVNAPTEESKRHIEAATISVMILKKYHEWLSETQ